MSRRTFWIALALALAAVVLLPAALVGLLAIVNGLTTGNGRLALVGAISLAAASVIAGVGWWLVRRSLRQSDS